MLICTYCKISVIQLNMLKFTYVAQFLCIDILTNLCIVYSCYLHTVNLLPDSTAVKTLTTMNGCTTVWPKLLAGNLFWQIGNFESNPPIFHPPKLHSVMSSIFGG